MEGRLRSRPFRFLVRQCFPPPVEPPFLPGVSHEENDEQKQQREVVELRAEVAPYGDALSRTVLPKGL